jgi:hypothetical protein
MPLFIRGIFFLDHYFYIKHFLINHFYKRSTLKGMAQGTSKLPTRGKSAFTAPKRQRIVKKPRTERAKLQAHLDQQVVVKINKRIEASTLAKATKMHDSLSVLNNK